MRVSGRGERVPWSAQQIREVWGKPYARRRRPDRRGCRRDDDPQGDADHPTDPRRYRVVVGLLPSRAVARSAYRRSGPAPPVLRYPPCAAACMARAVSSLRSGTGHASRSVVGEVHRFTPCRVRMARAVASSVTSHAVDAHDVPLRGW